MKNSKLSQSEQTRRFYKRVAAPVTGKVFKENLQRSFDVIDDPDPIQEWLNETLIHDVPRSVMEEAIRKNRFFVDDSVTYDVVSANPDDWDEFTEHELSEGRMYLVSTTSTRYFGD